MLLLPTFCKGGHEILTNQTIENQDEILNQASNSNEANENKEISNESTADEQPTVTQTDNSPVVEEQTNEEVSKTPVHNPDDFDWTMDRAGFGSYNNEANKELEALYANTIRKIEDKTLVMAKVVSMDKDNVLVDIGYKSDGLIATSEFRDTPDLKVGDEIDVFVDETENALGQLVLSRKKAIQEGAWEKIVAIMDKGEIVSGYITSRTKGGLAVDVMGLEAFLPGSQIDVKPVRDYDQYVGKVMDFKVVKINDTFKNVVISHKAIIEDDIEAQKAEMISKLEIGQVLEGVVKNMTSFGVFVDLGGLDGLLHITDISWGRINHPEDVLELDQKIQVVVLEFDDNKKRISLGMKQLTPHPWEKMSAVLELGKKIKGKVVTVADYGAFIEIEPGIEGLVHVSEMSWSQHLKNPSDFLKVGDDIETIVLDLDKDQHKLSLGIKQLIPDPWENITERYPVDSKHKGIVRNLTNYGLFIELEEGVDGLVHVSDLSWSKKIKHPAEFIKKGEELEVVVLEIDRDNRRLSLGHKQLDENPWDTFETIFELGSDHTATVTEVNDKGALVSMPYGVEAFVPNKHGKKEDNTMLKVDDTLDFRVIEFGKEAKRLLVSHTDIWKQKEREAKREGATTKRKTNKKNSKFVNNMNDKTERSTLGELDALAALKEQMDSNVEAAKKETLKKKETPKAKAKDEVKIEAANTSDEMTEDVVNQKKANLLNIIGSATEENKDDLKKVNGIGPVYEKKLNEIGIYTWEQLSKLTSEAVADLEQLTKWPGRVERDNWIEQAKELCK
jgi:small subunit ribosomal protein S1